MGTIYFVNGFLDAGKTTFIKELIARESFRIPGKTLIILCEEGDQEYDEAELARANAVLEVIEDEGDIILDPDEYLPYDINSDHLELDEVGFSVMCMDSLERCKVYEGKKVHFTAQAFKMKNGTDLEFVAGRLIMTCCEADMSFAGIICGYPKAYELDNKEWVDVTGIIRVVFDKEAGRELPVCRVIDLKKITAPDDEYISMI